MGCYLGDRSQAGSLPFGLELLPGGGGGRTGSGTCYVSQGRVIAKPFFTNVIYT